MVNKTGKQATAEKKRNSIDNKIKMGICIGSQLTNCISCSYISFPLFDAINALTGIIPSPAILIDSDSKREK